MQSKFSITPFKSPCLQAHWSGKPFKWLLTMWLSLSAGECGSCDGAILDHVWEFAIQWEYSNDEKERCLISFFPAGSHWRMFLHLCAWREVVPLLPGMLLLTTASFLKTPFEKEEIVRGRSHRKGIFQMLILVGFSRDTRRIYRTLLAWLL